jgi:hypothetical protein
MGRRSALLGQSHYLFGSGMERVGNILVLGGEPLADCGRFLCGVS